VYLSFGFHPSRADSHSGHPPLFEQLRHFLAHERAVAVGEVGLDYRPSCSERTKERQRLIFRGMLRVALELRKPVVVHCRGFGRPEAEHDCLEIMKDELPQLFPIHRHCFTGSLADLHAWRLLFPNTVFGFTAASSSYPQLAAHLPLAHTVLETDAPYM
ncbi:hypothetical protein CAPTEDRAFT_86863, partial [Capitella teleta]